MRLSRTLWCGCLVAAALCAGRVHAQNDVGIVDQNLTCAVRGNDVDISWQIEFIRPIDAWLILRDGELLARLRPDARRYQDTDVPAGDHFYELHAVDGDSIGRMGQCSVVVGDFGVRCRVEGLDVHLAWGPILIDVAIDAFLIRENGRVVARVGPNERSYTRTVGGPGTYRYVVTAITGDAEFRIGACTAIVRNPAFSCTVDPPTVLLDWSEMIFPAIPLHFEVFWNHELLASINAPRFRHEPGPGRHLYQVWVVFDMRPDDPVDVANGVEAIGGIVDVGPDGSGRALIGQCEVVMPGSSVPPPEDLTCLDLDAPPDLRIDDTSLLGPHDVLLVWQRPVDYDRIIIARGFQFIAVIPGDQFWYIDRNIGPGTYTYRVIGVLDGRLSRPAECTVTVPLPEIEPPRELTCRYVGPTADEVEGIDDPDVLPRRYVQLDWVNGRIEDLHPSVLPRQAYVDRCSLMTKL